MYSSSEQGHAVSNALTCSNKIMSIREVFMKVDYGQLQNSQISLALYYTIYLWYKSFTIYYITLYKFLFINQGSLSTGKWHEKKESISFADFTFLVTYKYLERDDIQKSGEEYRPSPDDESEEKESSEGKSSSLTLIGKVFFTKIQRKSLHH